MVDKTYTRLIENTYKNLLDEIKSYRPGTSLALIENAYNFAQEAHKDQKRESGEPFFIHPLTVALILAQMRSDLESIAAGILHDVVEDTSYTLEDITARFGAEIAQLVDGVTKIAKVQYVSKVQDPTQDPDPEETKISKGEKEKLAAKANEQAENYRKLFFHMS